MYLFVKLFLVPILLFGNVQRVDLIVYHAKIHTVDRAFTTAEAMAVKDGRIVAVGTTKEIRSAYVATETYDAGGNYIYPGFIDAHAHFVNYALGLQTANLVGTTSWHDVLKKLRDFAQTHTEGWLTGHG